MVLLGPFTKYNQPGFILEIMTKLQNAENLRPRNCLKLTVLKILLSQIEISWNKFLKNDWVNIIKSNCKVNIKEIDSQQQKCYNIPLSYALPLFIKRIFNNHRIGTLGNKN